MATNPAGRTSRTSKKLGGFYRLDHRATALVIENIKDEAILDAFNGILPRGSFGSADVKIARELLTEVVAYFQYVHYQAPTVREALDVLDEVQRLSSELLIALASNGPLHAKRSRIAQSVWDAIEATVGDTHADFSIKVLRSYLRAISGDPRARDHLESKAAKHATLGSHHDNLLSGVAYRFFFPRAIKQTYSTSWTKEASKARSSSAAKRKLAPATLRVSDVARLAFRFASLLPKEMRASSEAALIERHKKLLPQWRDYLIKKALGLGSSPEVAKAVATSILRGTSRTRFT